MDPYVALSVTYDADDDAVEERYRALIRRHPPDVDPDAFATIRAAYELLRTREARADARLFYSDPAADHRALAQWVTRSGRTPQTAETIAALVGLGIR